MKRWIAVGMTVLSLLAATLATAADVASGPVVRDAWARATAPGAGVAAVYLTIVGGTQQDRLVSASTDAATMAQIHSVREVDGLTQMREVEHVDIAPRATVVFAPQGLHLMLMDLRSALVAGSRFKVTLQFAHAGRRDVDVVVLASAAAPPGAH